MSFTYQAPRRWLQFGKYLLPLGMKAPGGPRTRPPRRQASVKQLADDHPDAVQLHMLGADERLPEFNYASHDHGRRSVLALGAETVPAAHVARLQRGMSFGRHCCVIAASGEALRETSFSHEGQVLISKRPLSRWRLRYWRKRWEGDVTSRPWLPAKQRIEGRVAALNARCCHNFFHWLIEILPRLATLRRAGVEADHYLIDCLSPFKQSVLAALGVGAGQLIQPHCRLLLEADELVAPSLPSPTCLREFSAVLLGALGVDAPVAAGRRIFITRRKTGARTLANETQLEFLLRAAGFETHAMEDYPLATQARLIREAEMVVATHGAGLANLLFARPGTRVIEIVPRGRFNAACYPKRSRIFGLHHQQVVATQVRRQVLEVSLDDVAAALAEAERPIALFAA
jgi:hypothetical protein